MTQTILDQDAELSLERVKRWRNLWFAKDGNSRLGGKVFDDKEDAFSDGQKLLKDANEEVMKGNKGYIYINNAFFCVLSQVSYFIPMPVGGNE